MISSILRTGMSRTSISKTILKKGFSPNFCFSSKLMNVRKSVHLLNSEPINEISNKARKVVGVWLMTCGGLTFATVVIGGVTRITNSGLSIVDWHPFKEFPPINGWQWIQEFDKYKLYPEYKIRNKNITLEEFQWIWYMEYLHRSLGRSIGALYFIPAAVFWYKKWFTKAMKPRVILLGGILAFQGFLGWYMVKSGLQEQPHQRDPKVSHYRLAAHLGTAFVFYSLLLWSGLTHLLPPLETQYSKKMVSFRRFTHMTKGFVFLTALSGALVAGLDAGLVYNSFPKMADRWIPTDILSLSPKWKNFTENTTTVQFDHRLFGEIVFCAVTGLWVYSRRLPLNSRTRLAVNCLMAVTLLQVGLGIATLLLYVPKHLAATHQAGALTVLSTAVWLTHELKLLKRIPK